MPITTKRLTSTQTLLIYPVKVAIHNVSISYSNHIKAVVMQVEKTVFISYRRDSTGKLFARLLAEELTRHGYDVFLDVDSLDAGKWETQILTQVPLRSHFLLLLTPGSLDRCAMV